MFKNNVAAVQSISVILSLSLVTYPTYCFLHVEVDNLQVSEFLMVYWWPVDVLLLLCLGAHALARYTVVCPCVCLCRLLQLLKDQRSASKSFYRLLVMFSWILIRGFAK